VTHRWLRLLSPVLLALALATFAGAPAALAAEPEHGAGHAQPEHGAEHGGGHGEHGLDPKRFAFQLINFGILVFILGWFGGRAINKALAGRHDQIKKDLDEAAQTRAAAEARLVTHERRLANLEKEAAALRTSIKDEAKKEEELLVAAAVEKARRIQDETRFLMDQQVKEAELRLREEVASTAVRVAEEIVRRSVRPDDEVRLNQTFVADVERAPGQAPVPGQPAGAPAKEPRV
jgi:F-type H+-transporting ATPase subunit b